MLIIRRLNCIDAAFGIVNLKISEWSKITSVQFAAPLTYFQIYDTKCYINTIQPPDDEHKCSKHVEDHNKRIVK